VAVSGISYGPALLARLRALAEADPARERCGLVVRRGGGLEVIPVENVADRLHAADPVAHPRTARDAYEMDPLALLRLQKELRATGGEIVAAWHSHVGGGAAFSARDREGALADGVPLLPGAEQLVVALRDGRAVEIARYRFEGGEYVAFPVA
jgi:proteasome lid subunit RPN8/RPN11